MVLRRSLASAGVTVLVAALLPVVTAHTAGAIAGVSCAASAPIYATLASGAFVQLEHLEPENGAPSWAAQRQLGTWLADARRLAGPGGDILSAVNTGELRRSHWNGSTWDTFGGAQYEVIDRDPGWARYATAEYRNRITVDSLGDIYTVEPDGYLHWRRYDRSTRTWTHRTVSDWQGDPGVDLITAAGPGIIYARYGPYLERFEYHAASQRSRLLDVEGDGWDQFGMIFSPGADILYGLRNNIPYLPYGELVWYRYDPETRAWAGGLTVDNQPVGRQAATGWQYNYEITAAPDACQSQSASVWPTRPEVTPWQRAPVTLMVSRPSRLHYSYVDEDGRAVHADTADLSGGSPIRLAAVPGMTDLTGKTSMLSTTTTSTDYRATIVGLGLDAELRSNTKTTAAGPWFSQAASLGGFFSSPVSLNPDPGCGITGGGLQARGPYAAFAVDEHDTLWVRTVLGRNGPNGLLGTWTKAPRAVRIPVGSPPLVVLPDAHSSAGSPWCVRVFSYDRDTTSYGYTGAWGPEDWDLEWHGLGGSGFVGQAAVVDRDWCRGLVVLATGADGTVSGRFPGSSTWTALPGVRAAGPPSATLAPDNKLKVVVRGTDGQIYWTTTSQAPCVTSRFEPWQVISGTGDSGTDPTVAAFDGTWVVAYRTELDLPRLRKYVPPVLAASTGFVDVPLAPPV